VRRTVLALGSGHRLRCHGAGTAHVIVHDGEPMMVRVERDTTFGALDFWLEVHGADAAEAAALADDLLGRAIDDASPLRGRALRFTYPSEFNVEILDGAELSLDDATIDRGVAAELRSNLVVPLTERGRLGRLVASRGVLLLGPPGTGKSTAVRAARGSLEGTGVTVVVALPGSLLGRDSIDILLHLVRDLAPCLVVIEELDLVAGEHHRMSDAGRLGDLLNLLDGLGDDGIFLLATTNRADALDEALTGRPGRIDRRVEVGAASAAM